MIQLACAARGIDVLLGARDGMREALLKDGASPALMVRYEAARPIVIGSTWCGALFVASAAVIIQLSIVWSAVGVPSEFHTLLVQAVALPALLAWSRGRHKYSGKMA